MPQQSFLLVDLELMQQDLAAGDDCEEQQSSTVSLPRQDTAVFDSSVKRSGSYGAMAADENCPSQQEDLFEDRVLVFSFEDFLWHFSRHVDSSSTFVSLLEEHLPQPGKLLFVFGMLNEWRVVLYDNMSWAIVNKWRFFDSEVGGSCQPPDGARARQRERVRRFSI